jgi:hypothetical protein
MAFLVRLRLDFDHLHSLLPKLKDQLGQVFVRDERGDGHSPQVIRRNPEEVAGSFVSQPDVEPFV